MQEKRLQKNIINYTKNKMETILNLFLISVIVVFIVDISGAVDSLKSGIKWILTRGKMNSSDYRLKPFDCSLCCVWWCGLIYLLVTGEFTLPYITVVCLLACFSGLIKSSILLIEDAVVKIIKVIYKLID